jgi:hypothetical protein
VNTPCDDCGFYPCRCEARAVSNERDALRADLESMEKGLAVECNAHMKTLADLDAARKLLGRALNDRQHPGGSWADQCEDLINAITQKRGG